jgi:hypothetical protein
MYRRRYGNVDHDTPDRHDDHHHDHHHHDHDHHAADHDHHDHHHDDHAASRTDSAPIVDARCDPMPAADR